MLDDEGEMDTRVFAVDDDEEEGATRFAGATGASTSADGLAEMAARSHCLSIPSVAIAYSVVEVLGQEREVMALPTALVAPLTESARTRMTFACATSKRRICPDWKPRAMMGLKGTDEEEDASASAASVDFLDFLCFFD